MFFFKKKYGIIIAIFVIFVLFLLQIALCIFVAQRIKEIEVTKTKRMVINIPTFMNIKCIPKFETRTFLE